MNTDVRGGLAVLCLAGIIGLLWLGTLASEGAAGRLQSSTGGGAALLALVGLGLLMKGILARRD
jgi:hypothetical protein